MDRIRQLEILLRVANCGSFASAAKSLEITPSAVSRSIAELERTLHTAVFNRTTRQLQLTDEGRRLVDRAGDVLRRLADLEDAVAPVHDRTAGTVRIGISPAISRHVIMPRLARFIERYPDIQLDVRSTQDPRALQRENLDLLFHVTEALPDSGIVAIPLGKGRPAAYASSGYLTRNPAPQRPEEVRNHPCLVFKPPWLHRARDVWQFRRDDETQSVRVVPAVVCEDRESLLVAALHGAGLVYIACFDPHLVGPGGLVRLLPEWECVDDTGIYLMHRQASRLSGRVRAVADFCRKAFGDFDPAESTILHRLR